LSSRLVAIASLRPLADRLAGHAQRTALRRAMCRRRTCPLHQLGSRNGRRRPLVDVGRLLPGRRLLGFPHALRRRHLAAVARLLPRSAWSAGPRNAAQPPHRVPSPEMGIVARVRFGGPRSALQKLAAVSRGNTESRPSPRMPCLARRLAGWRTCWPIRSAEHPFVPTGLTADRNRSRRSMGSSILRLSSTAPIPGRLQ